MCAQSGSRRLHILMFWSHWAYEMKALLPNGSKFFKSHIFKPIFPSYSQLYVLTSLFLHHILRITSLQGTR